jgi:hypothetical protein
MSNSLLPDALWNLIQPLLPSLLSCVGSRVADPLTRPCLSNWGSVRLAQRNSLEDTATGTGLPFWHDLLAAVT